MTNLSIDWVFDCIIRQVLISEDRINLSFCLLSASQVGFDFKRKLIIEKDV